jgi:hypothetical protein
VGGEAGVLEHGAQDLAGGNGGKFLGLGHCVFLSGSRLVPRPGGRRLSSGSRYGTGC